jgi:hypothetical protein
MKKSVGMFSGNGMKWVASLPEGYDERTKLVTAPAGGLIVLHPDKPPLRVLKNGSVEQLLPAQANVKHELKDECGDDRTAAQTKTDAHLL